MSQKSSLPQPTQSVSRVLTADTAARFAQPEFFLDAGATNLD